MSVRVQTGDFDVGAEIAALRRGDPKIGAVAAFVGLVRDINDGSTVRTMTLEHYPGMTVAELERVGSGGFGGGFRTGFLHGRRLSRSSGFRHLRRGLFAPNTML